MASTMKFDDWQNTDGTSIATTNASGDITFEGAANFDSGTLYVDSTNNSVGIGTTSPEEELHIEADQDGDLTQVLIENANQRIRLGAYHESGVAQYAKIQSEDDGGSNTALALNPEGGNVGIGTTSPNAELDVAGDATSTGHFTAQSGGVDGGIVLGQTFNAGYVGLRTAGMSENSSEYVLMSNGSSTFVSGGTGGDVHISAGGNSSTHKIHLDHSESTTNFAGDANFDSGTLYVDSTLNRVGIGTTSPTATLDVSAAAPILKLTDNNSPGSHNGSIQFRDMDNSLIARAYMSATDLCLDATADDLLLQTGSTTRMAITETGDVGIGTSTPTATLEVSASTPVLKITDDNSSGLHNGSIQFRDTSNTLISRVYMSGNDLCLDGTADDLVLQTGSTPRMVITELGKVTLGGSNSGYDMLDVGYSGNLGSFRVYANNGVESFRVAGSVVRASNVSNLTTASAANVFINSSDHTMYRSTSSLKYKTDVETLEDEYADVIFELRPVWYRSTTGNDPDGHSYYGLIAEEVAEVEPRLVHFGPSSDCSCEEDEEGHIEHEQSCVMEPEGVFYERLVPHLISVVQRQQETIDQLTARIEALENN